jgi:hypothetical protein
MVLMLAAGRGSRADEYNPDRPSDEGATDPGTPAVRLDKSQFNLFNPTPEDALRQ